MKNRPKILIGRTDPFCWHAFYNRFTHTIWIDERIRLWWGKEVFERILWHELQHSKFGWNWRKNSELEREEIKYFEKHFPKIMGLGELLRRKPLALFFTYTPINYINVRGKYYFDVNWLMVIFYIGLSLWLMMKV